MKTPEDLVKPPSALDSLNFKRLHLTPRQLRALNALVECDGWITRERIDRIAGASNGPQIIQDIRRKLTGYDGLDTSRVDVVDRDGKLCKPGRYRLNSIGRARIARLLQGEAYDPR
jgi:hypothetical protein